MMLTRLVRNVTRICSPTCLLQYNGMSTTEKGHPGQFARSKIGRFFQEPPVITNPFKSDHFLQRCLARILPKEVREVIGLQVIVWIGYFNSLIYYRNKWQFLKIFLCLGIDYVMKLTC